MQSQSLDMFKKIGNKGLISNTLDVVRLSYQE